MPNESQGTSYPGQHPRAESSSKSSEFDWSTIRPLPPKPTSDVTQKGSPTALPQDGPNSEDFSPQKSVALPKRFHLHPTARLRTKQLWEGTVISCTKEHFIARIKDCTNAANPDEIATFMIEEISQDDQELINPGAAFYWAVGTEKTPAGQVKNIAMVKFRRTPRWQRSSFWEADRKAREVLSLFDQE